MEHNKSIGSLIVKKIIGVIMFKNLLLFATLVSLFICLSIPIQGVQACPQHETATTQDR